LRLQRDDEEESERGRSFVCRKTNGSSQSSLRATQRNNVPKVTPAGLEAGMQGEGDLIAKGELTYFQRRSEGFDSGISSAASRRTSGAAGAA